MPPVDRSLPIFGEKKMKFLKGGMEKVEEQRQGEKEKAKTINEHIGKFVFLNEVGWPRICIYNHPR